jgi:hypothetical protein
LKNVNVLDIVRLDEFFDHTEEPLRKNEKGMDEHGSRN